MGDWVWNTRNQTLGGTKLGNALYSGFPNACTSQNKEGQEQQKKQEERGPDLGAAPLALIDPGRIGGARARRTCPDLGAAPLAKEARRERPLQWEIGFGTREIRLWEEPN